MPVRHRNNPAFNRKHLHFYVVPKTKDDPLDKRLGQYLSVNADSGKWQIGIMAEKAREGGIAFWTAASQLWKRMRRGRVSREPIGDRQVKRIVEMRLHKKPAHAKHW
jgi:hypothetical protein